MGAGFRIAANLSICLIASAASSTASTRSYARAYPSGFISEVHDLTPVS